MPADNKELIIAWNELQIKDDEDLMDEENKRFDDLPEQTPLGHLNQQESATSLSDNNCDKPEAVARAGSTRRQQSLVQQ